MNGRTARLFRSYADHFPKNIRRQAYQRLKKDWSKLAPRQRAHVRLQLEALPPAPESDETSV